MSELIEVLKVIKAYGDIIRRAEEVATKWVKIASPGCQAYGTTISDGKIRFHVGHYDGVRYGNAASCPIEFIVDDSGLRQHALDTKAAYDAAFKRLHDRERELKAAVANNELTQISNRLQSRSYENPEGNPYHGFFTHPAYGQVITFSPPSPAFVYPMTT